MGSQGANPTSEGLTRSGAVRLGSLDGLRGVAALIVVFHHSLLSSSASLEMAYLGPVSYRPGSFDWLLARTPLHIVWAGPEMVLVFFVLSGYVLTLPALLRGLAASNSAYYRRRFVRLYLPVWAALVVGGCLHELHTVPSVGATWWLNAHTTPLSLSTGLRLATLVSTQPSWAFTSVLWSLRDEVFFSLLLPVFLVIGLWAARRRWRLAVAVAGCCLIMWIGAGHSSVTASLPVINSQDLRFLPIFMLGSLLALKRESLHCGRQRLFPLAALLSVCLLTGSYVWDGADSSGASGFAFLADVAGACLAVWTAVNFQAARRLLTTKRLLWLGSRSFSLYLVHEPIVVVFGFLLGPNATVLPVLLVSVPVSLLVAEAFWRLVENPAVQLARRAGRLGRGRVGVGIKPAAERSL